ncbi:uncharacterized protein LOC134221572 [Armigeres subalbatus]|uniref:uncharacterized protein LOC134221572 n=1 Tax=Armigeres subalbatus TaxID=124917 RepID=UPI002ED629E2
MEIFQVGPLHHRRCTGSISKYIMAMESTKVGTYESKDDTGEHGFHYQRGLAYGSLLKLIRKKYSFDFYYERQDADKFDDLTVTVKQSETVQGYFVQVKHASKEGSTIEYSQLFPDHNDKSTNSDFSMFKYFKSYLILQKMDPREKQLIIFTNNTLRETDELKKLVSFSVGNTDKIMNEVLQIVPAGRQATFKPTAEACKLLKDYINKEFLAIKKFIVDLFGNATDLVVLDNHKHLLHRILSQTLNSVAFIDGFDEHNANEDVLKIFNAIKLDLDVSSVKISPKKEIFKKWPDVDKDFLPLKESITDLCLKGNVSKLLVNYKAALMNIIEKSRQTLCFAKSFIDHSNICKTLEGKLKSLEGVEVKPNEMFLNEKKVNHKNLPKEEKEFTNLVDALVELFEKGTVKDILKQYRIPLCQVLEISGKDKYKFKKSFIMSSILCQQLEKKFVNLNEKEITLEEAFFDNRKTKIRIIPENKDEIEHLATAIEEVFETGTINETLNKYKTFLKSVLAEKEGNESFRFSKSFYEHYELYKISEYLTRVEVIPEEMFLDKNFPDKGNEFDSLTNAITRFFNDKTVDYVLKKYKSEMTLIIEKSGNNFKFTSSFIAGSKLCRVLESEMGELDGEEAKNSTKILLDGKESKFKSIPTDEAEFNTFKDALKKMFETGAVAEILEKYKSALYQVLEKTDNKHGLKFRKTFIASNRLCKALEKQLRSLEKISVTTDTDLFDENSLPSESRQFEDLKNAIEDLFKTGKVADILKEYKVALNNVLEKTEDGKKLRFKTNTNIVLCKLLEIDLKSLSKVRITVPSTLLDAKNSKLKIFPTVDSNIISLRNAVQSLWKNGSVGKVLLKYQTPLQEILVKNYDGSIKLASSFKNRNDNQSIRLLFELLKADSIDMNLEVKPQRLLFKTLPSSLDHVNRLKNSLVEFFKTGAVDDVLIDYQVGLKDILKPCYEIKFSKSFSEPSEEFELLHKQLQNDNIDYLDRSLSVFVKNRILDEKTSGLRKMPFFAEKSDIESFFKQFVLLHSQPHDLNPFVVDELFLCMKPWMRTDVFGNLRKEDGERAFKTFEESFKEALKNGTEKNENNVLSERSLDVFQKQLQDDFEKVYPELKAHKQLRTDAETEIVSDQSLKTYKIKFNNILDTFLKSNMKYIEIADKQLVIDLNDKLKEYQCFILTAEPGMGKTMFLHYVALEMQKENNMGTVLLVDLNKIQNLSEKAKDNVLNILEPILSPTNFKRIRNVMNESTKNEPITIFFDAFDEIHEVNRDIVIDLFKALFQSKSLRLIICGRKHIEQILTEGFNTFEWKPVMLSIRPMGDETRKLMMKKIWNVSDDNLFNEYSERLLGKTKVLIPLLDKILAELFRERFKKFCGKAKKEQEKELNELERNRFDQVTIYEMFFNTIFRTNAPVAIYDEISSLYDSCVHGSFDEHLLLAIKTLDVTELDKKFKNVGNRRKYDNFRQKCFKASEKSILIEIVNKEIKFTHQSFGEFLIAKYLFDNLHDHKTFLSDIFRRNENIKTYTMMMIENHTVRSIDKNDEEKQIWFQDLGELFEECNQIALFACESSCFELVKFFLGKYKTQSENFVGYDKMLHVAIGNGSLGICSLLINDYKFDVDKPLNGNPPICVCNVLERIINLNLGKEVKPLYPLFLAAVKGQNEIVELLIEKGTNIELSTNEGHTAMHVAALSGKVDVLRTLIDKKAKIDVHDKNGWTPLHCAAQEGHNDAVVLLIRKGANIELSTKYDGVTPLHCAAQEGHNDAVVLLIRKGANIELSTEDGRTAMHVAAFKGRVDVLSTLIDKKAKIDAQTENGVTPLHCAAQEGHNDAVVLLIRKGANIELSKEAGRTAMHSAAFYRRVDVLSTLIDKKAKIDAHDENGWTPLHNAAQEGYNDAVVLLIRKGANIELSTKYGRTAMHIAAFNGRVDVLCTLIDEKAKIDAHDKDGWTPLHYAAQQGHNDVVVLLIRKGARKDDRTAMFSAVFNRRLDFLRTFIDKKAKIDAHDENGVTPLHCAAQEGHNDAVVLLNREGANIERSARNGITAMHIAAFYGSVDVLCTLIDEKAKIDAHDKDGWTPLHYAAEQGHNDAVVLLIRKGARKDDRTAMLSAAYNRRMDVLRTCIDKMRKFDAHDENGWTPLHCAAQGCHNDAVVLLNREGANIELSAKNGGTAMHVAAFNGKVDLLSTLIDKKAKIDAQNENGVTPLHCAAQEGHNDAVVLLIRKGANIELSAKDGGTAMHVAASGGRVDVLSTLIDKKAKIDAQTENGVTPLHFAAQEGHNDAVVLLIRKGANIELSRKDGRTAMHVAAFNGRVDVLSTLIVKKAKIDAHDENGVTPLHCAAQEGHNDAVVLLIRKGANIELSAKDGGTAMHVAASDGRVDVLSTLIDKKAKIDAQNENGWTPLHCAAQEGHNDAVVLLIRKGANIELSRKDGRTAMHSAAFKRRVDVLSTLIDKKAKIDAHDENGWTPLHCAAQEGHNDAVVLLIREGANIELSTKDGGTAMHVAALSGKVDVLRTLIDKKAKIDAHDENGVTPLHFAAQEGHNDAVVLLIRKGANIELSRKDGRTAMHSAAFNGRVDVLSTLIDKKAKIDAHDENGWTPLHHAAQEGHNDAVVLLIRKGANIELSAKDGGTAMHVAASDGRVDVLSTLIDKKAKIDAQNENGWTPLHCAAQEGHNDAVVLLIRKGANIELSRKAGRTAMHSAAFNRRVDVLSTLIDKKAKIDAHDENGWTPLHCAAQEGHNDAVVLLIRKGANIELSTKYGRTAMHVAAFNGRVDVLCTLIDEKAKIDAHDEDGWTPLHFAAQQGNNDAVVLLIRKGANIELSRKDGRTAMHSAAFNRRAKIDAHAENGWTPLHCAAQEGHNDAVVLLIRKGANIELSMKDGRTVMHVAASDGRVDVLSTLIDKKAKIDAQTENGVTPLHFAAQEGHNDAVVLLIREGANIELSLKDGRTAMHVAAFNGRVDVLSTLIDKKAKIDAHDENGWTPLHCAAQGGHNDAVVLLIREGANIELSMKDGGTAMHVAALSGKVDVLRTLIDKKAKIDAQTENGVTPLHCAAQEGHNDAVVLLIRKSANIELSRKDGRTAMHSAAFNRRVDVLSTLIDKKAKIDAHAENGWTPLHCAAQEGHNDAVVLLIRKGANIELSRKDGRTAMHSAAFNGRVDVLSTLIDKKAKIDAHDENGVTPLHCAAQEGHNDAVVLLIRKGANIELSRKDGRTAMHSAAFNGRVDVLSTLIDKKAKIDAHDENGVTPLHCAAQEGHNDAVVLLIRKGANIELSRKDGRTAMHSAAFNGRVDVLSTLIDKKAKIDAHDENGWTPLHCAAQGGHNDAVVLLIREGANIELSMKDGGTAMHVAALSGKVDVLRTLIDKKAKIDAQTENGVTPLHCAAQEGHNDAVVLLIRKGANIELSRKDGRTAMHSAAFNGRVDVLSTLIDKKAKIDAHAENGWTPLHCAAQEGHNDAVVLLIRKGANIELSRKDGRTAMHSAAFNGRVDVLSTLIDKKAKIDAHDENGVTPLHCAAQEGHNDAVVLLIRKGANIELSMKDGRTAMHVAASDGRVDVLSTLIDKKAKIDAQTENGVTPLHFAAQEGHNDAVVLLIRKGANN